MDPALKFIFQMYAVDAGSTPGQADRAWKAYVARVFSESSVLCRRFDALAFPGDEGFPDCKNVDFAARGLDGKWAAVYAKWSDGTGGGDSRGIEAFAQDALRFGADDWVLGQDGEMDRGPSGKARRAGSGSQDAQASALGRKIRFSSVVLARNSQPLDYEAASRLAALPFPVMDLHLNLLLGKGLCADMDLWGADLASERKAYGARRARTLGRLANRGPKSAERRGAALGAEKSPNRGGAAPSLKGARGGFAGDRALEEDVRLAPDGLKRRLAEDALDALEARDRVTVVCPDRHCLGPAAARVAIRALAAEDNAAVLAQTQWPSGAEEFVEMLGDLSGMGVETYYFFDPLDKERAPLLPGDGASDDQEGQVAQLGVGFVPSCLSLEAQAAALRDAALRRRTRPVKLLILCSPKRMIETERLARRLKLRFTLALSLGSVLSGAWCDSRHRLTAGLSDAPSPSNPYGGLRSPKRLDAKRRVFFTPARTVFFPAVARDEDLGIAARGVDFSDGPYGRPAAVASLGEAQKEGMSRAPLIDVLIARIHGRTFSYRGNVKHVGLGIYSNPRLKSERLKMKNAAAKRYWKLAQTVEALKDDDRENKVNPGFEDDAWACFVDSTDAQSRLRAGEMVCQSASGASLSARRLVFVCSPHPEVPIDGEFFEGAETDDLFWDLCFYAGLDERLMEPGRLEDLTRVALWNEWRFEGEDYEKQAERAGEADKKDGYFFSIEPPEVVEAFARAMRKRLKAVGY